MRLSARFSQQSEDRFNASLPIPHLRRFARQQHRRDCAALRLGASRARSWRRAVHRFARSLWADAGRGGPGFSRVQSGRNTARRVGNPRRRQSAHASRRDGEFRSADGRGRSVRHRDRSAEQGRRTPDAGVRRSGVPRRNPSQVPLPRSAPRASAQQHHQRRTDHRLDPPPHARERFLRVSDADLDRLVAGRRERFSCAVAAAPRQVLRAAAGAAAVQTADDDFGVRPLLPDRALFPRRGRARGPLARRVLSARRRDELRHAGRRVRRGRAGDAGRVRGIRGRQTRDADVSADPLRASALQIRYRQAGPAQSDRDAGCVGNLPRLGFKVFARILETSAKNQVWAVPAPGGGSRAFCDRMNSWAQGEGQPGLGYIFFVEENGQTLGRGPVANNVGPERTEQLRAQLGLKAGDAVFFVAGDPNVFVKFAGPARTKVGQDLGLIAKDRFEFCWIVDFPMFEWSEEEKKIDFSHNPFSMPNMALEEFLALDPTDRETILSIKAIQYDIVCNGIELSSGAIRNHRPEVMRKAFAIAGYGEDTLEQKFGGMLHALSLGAPPHGGIAPGIDRIVMLLCGEENLREVVLFPMNQRAEDLMMGAPAEVTPRQLRELHIRLNLPEKS